MVCRTPGSSEIGPLSFTSVGDHDLRELNISYPAPALRLVTIGEEIEADAASPLEPLAAVPSYEVWQYMPREARERRVAATTRRRMQARRKQARKAEKAAFQITAAAALFVSLIGGLHIGSAGAVASHHYGIVTVAPGDTLWTLASRYTPSGTATINTVGAIRAINPLLRAGTALRVGEQIRVPVQRV